VADAQTPGDLPAGASYDLLRRRLRARVREVVDSAAELDGRRIETFGSTPVRLSSSDRLHTDVACSPSDMARVGDVLVLGYNVSLDLANIEPEHVFSLYRRHESESESGDELVPVPADDAANFLADAAFREDFEKLYKFYGKARFADLRVANGQLLAAFRIGERLDDVVVLRWGVTDDGAITFLDSRGDRDYTWPDRHDVDWQESGRDDQIAGTHPAVSVLGEVFVGFRSGRMQIRVEDGSPGGRVELDEVVAVPGQSLADVAVGYAEVGDVLLLRVQLYSEAERFYIVSRRTRSVQRVDAVGDAIRTLPGGDGVVFPGGYHLATTGTRVFDVPVDGMIFEEAVVSPNGEDILYVFHDGETGEYLLAPYNMVRREISQVIPCHGFASFADGATVLFRGAPDDVGASRVHPIQWWDTPFVDDDHLERANPDGDAWVRRVGNADLVSGLGDVFDVGRLVEESDPTERTWEAVIVAARRALDTNLWMADPEAKPVHDAMRDIVDTSGLLVDEYVKVRRLRAEAADRVDEASRAANRTIAASTQAKTPTDVVGALGSLRRSRGEASLLSDVPEVDDTAVEALIAELDAAIGGLAERAGSILDDDLAFEPFSKRLDVLVAQGTQAPTALEVDAVAAELVTVISDLDAVVDAVSALDGGDPTARTRIVRRVADVTAASNRARAQLDNHRRDLESTESAEAFDAEVALLEQTLSGAVVAASTPEDCDAELARLLVNAERVESRYGEDSDRIMALVELRDRINESLGARRSELVDERARRTQRLVEAARRLMVAVANRAGEASDEAEIAAFFATDQMVNRVRGIADQLDELGESGQGAELRNELKTTAEEARRTVRDRTDLVAEDGSLAFGTFRFAPNSQPFEVVMSPAAAGIDVAVTGTDLRIGVAEELSKFGDLLDRSYPSETRDVARAEYLAWAVLGDAIANDTVDELHHAASVPDNIAEIVRGHGEHRHGEGYEIGVHDHDAARILGAVLTSGESTGLHHSSRARGLARLFVSIAEGDFLASLTGRLAAARVVSTELTSPATTDRLSIELAAGISLALGLDEQSRGASLAAAFLVDELGTTDRGLATSSTAVELVRRFHDRLGADDRAVLDAALGHEADVMARHRLSSEWLSGLVTNDSSLAEFLYDVDEAAAILAAPDVETNEIAHPGASTVSGLVSDHRRIVDGTLTLRIDELADRVGGLFDEMEMRWPLYQDSRRGVMGAVHDDVGLDSHRPQVMAGFVRNRLIDRVLLPLVGSNLGRQIGTVDATDLSRSGLLVLTSPPGYGKTTLMSWVAARLGLLMVKVNGPALGLDTTSLDPGDAPNAAARAEVEKVNLALRLGRNVLLFIDDVQFTSPQFLSRFIPLADATRRIEGVVNGEAVTFDLRGKRFAVVMAGNPYSTGGARFELPDMLVNRADVHNLGDVADEHDDDFALSYLENSLTACPALAPMSIKLLDDIEPVLAMAIGRRAVTSDGLAHRWDAGELSETVRLVALLERVRKVVMAVNDAYVESAAIADSDRVAPPFLLQGSYRNMARIASRVVGAMTDEELDAIVVDHYRSEAQTLTDRAEQNLLALGALLDTHNDVEADRWSDITARYAAGTVDPAVGVVAALDRIATALGGSEVSERMAPPFES